MSPSEAAKKLLVRITRTYDTTTTVKKAHATKLRTHLLLKVNGKISLEIQVVDSRVIHSLELSHVSQTDLCLKQNNWPRI